MMASEALQPMHAKRNASEGLNAGAILEAFLPYVAGLLFLLAVLVAALDESDCRGAAANPSTLALVMSTGQPAPAAAADGKCKPPAAGVSSAPKE